MTDLPPPPPPNLAPPPGYVAYGGPNSAGGPFQRIRGISKALVVLMAIVVPAQIANVFSTIDTADDARKFLRGEISEADFTDAGGVSFGQLAGLLVIPVAVLTIIWMYRMAQNLRLLGRTDATWAPGWAIGGWFAPPCAIYAIPWLMFRELWKGSDPSVAPHDPTWKQGRVAPILNVWWVLYGLLPLVGFVSTANLVSQIRDTDDAEKLAENLDEFATLNTGLAVVSIVTAIVYLLLIRQLSERHMAATREP